MFAWRYIQKVYSLDTLDTRLTTSSKTPPDPTGDAPVDTKEKQDVAAKAQSSRWGTAEYSFYYLIFLTIVPLMFYVPFSVSRRKRRMSTE